VFNSVEEMDNIYVYLMEGTYPVCYWKGKVTEFTDPNPSYRWLVLKNDPAIGTVVNAHEAGMLQIKLSVNDVKQNGSIDFKQYKAWEKPPARRLKSQKIRCFIFQCRDIPAADSDGSSDSFISVWNPDSLELTTKVIDDSLNPIYFQTIEMLYDMADIDSAPPIVLNLWDRDGMLDSDDYLGRCTVYLPDASTNLKLPEMENEEEKANNMIPKP
jgi:hypothetical protein